MNGKTIFLVLSNGKGVNVWMNEWMNKWMNNWMNDWTKKQTIQSINQSINESINQSTLLSFLNLIHVVTRSIFSSSTVFFRHPISSALMVGISLYQPNPSSLRPLFPSDYLSPYALSLMSVCFCHTNDISMRVLSIDECFLGSGPEGDEVL